MFGIHGNAPLSFTVTTGTSNVIAVSTSFTHAGGPDGGTFTDAGAAGDATTGGDASACVPIPPQIACQGMCGGVSDGCSGKYDCPCGSAAAPPVCSSDASKLGACADPPTPLCSAFPGTVVTGCTDFQGGGYVATCCPP